MSLTSTMDMINRRSATVTRVSHSIISDVLKTHVHVCIFTGSRFDRNCQVGLHVAFTNSQPDSVHSTESDYVHFLPLLIQLVKNKHIVLF